jgi:catechol 2,3-dioxygenase-like lactoylglutathione lyase family enzyme
MKEVSSLKNESYDFYQKVCSLEKVKETYNNIFDEVLYFKSIWK